MTESQLPSGVRSINIQLKLCLQHAKRVKEKHHRHFNEEERKQWRWITEALETDVIAAQFDELDRDTLGSIHDMIVQVNDAIYAKDEVEAKNETPLMLFDECA